MIKLFFILLMLNSIFTFLSKTPFLMIFFLISQTLLITLTITMLNSTSWFSYILFLIFIGGLLILFIYINSLIPNQKISMNLKFNQMSFLIILTIIIILLINYTPEMNNMETTIFLNTELSLNSKIQSMMLKLYNKPTNYMMFLLINYLLLTLMIVVKIININKGPIRKNK
uniref:NADH-ubiquinone oxidoreductase chain 6 n=1 Tax=Athalia icar TaxID=2982297 RepID=A0A649X0B4_9HYME|nr:NADH dehydrogenase subunit 6 [Athalia icar]QGL07074.2 NADH dehydrogenase subunit 6 [Athalia icar]